MSKQKQNAPRVFVCELSVRRPDAKNPPSPRTLTILAFRFCAYRTGPDLYMQAKDGHGASSLLAHAPAHHICDVECPHLPEPRGANRKRQLAS